jgi:glucose-6-phosphate 1-dehydrogenase
MKEKMIKTYKVGSSGPKEAEEMMRKDHRTGWKEGVKI